MKSVVMPVCPYCGKHYEGNDLSPKVFPHSKLVKCGRCKERFYVSLQHRYIARRGSIA